MISLVIPVFNEEESLEALHKEVDEVVAAHGYQVEFVFVDDGSTDDSWRAIERLSSEDSRVRGVRFRRNFGKAAALCAGFDGSSGEIVITMDGDDWSLDGDPVRLAERST